MKNTTRCTTWSKRLRAKKSPIKPRAQTNMTKITLVSVLYFHMMKQIFACLTVVFSRKWFDKMSVTTTDNHNHKEIRHPLTRLEPWGQAPKLLATCLQVTAQTHMVSVSTTGPLPDSLVSKRRVSGTHWQSTHAYNSKTKGKTSKLQSCSFRSLPAW